MALCVFLFDDAALAKLRLRVRTAHQARGGDRGVGRGF